MYPGRPNPGTGLPQNSVMPGQGSLAPGSMPPGQGALPPVQTPLGLGFGAGGLGQSLPSYGGRNQLL